MTRYFELPLPDTLPEALPPDVLPEALPLAVPVPAPLLEPLPVPPGVVGVLGEVGLAGAEAPPAALPLLDLY